jgi:hypothetical protein
MDLPCASTDTVRKQVKEMELDDKRIPSTLFASAKRSSPDEIEAQHEKV